MSLIAAVGLNPTSSLAVTIRRNRGYAVRSIDAMAPSRSVLAYSRANAIKTGPELGLLDIGETHGRQRERFIEDIRFIRTAIVDPNAPDLAGLRPPQLAWRPISPSARSIAAVISLGRAGSIAG